MGVGQDQKIFCFPGNTSECRFSNLFSYITFGICIYFFHITSIYCNWHKTIFTFILLVLSATKRGGGMGNCWGNPLELRRRIPCSHPVQLSHASKGSVTMPAPIPALLCFLYFYLPWQKHPHSGPLFLSGEILFCPHCLEDLGQLSFIIAMWSFS